MTDTPTSPPARPTPRAQGQWALGLPRAAQPERADQEGRRRAQRARSGSRTSTPRGLRLHRPGRPARPVPLVGPLHAAQARHRRRLDRRRSSRRARGRVLHDAGAHRRRRADHRRSCALGEISTEFARDTADITDRQNIQCHWIRDRGRPGDLAAPRGGRACSTTEACGDCPRGDPRLPAGRHRRRRGHRRDARRSTRSSRRYIGNPEFSNLPRKFKTAISGRRSQDVVHEINDVAFVGVVPPRARPRLRPVGRRRPVDQPDAGAAARRLGPARRGARRLGGRHRDLPRLRLPPAARPGPG